MRVTTAKKIPSISNLPTIFLVAPMYPAKAAANAPAPATAPTPGETIVKYPAKMPDRATNFTPTEAMAKYSPIVPAILKIPVKAPIIAPAMGAAEDMYVVLCQI